jgi:hypothetical protein
MIRGVWIHEKKKLTYASSYAVCDKQITHSLGDDLTSMTDVNTNESDPDPEHLPLVGSVDEDGNKAEAVWRSPSVQRSRKEPSRLAEPKAHLLANVLVQYLDVSRDGALVWEEGFWGCSGGSNDFDVE